MSPKLFLGILSIIFTSYVFAQTTISGTVKDGENGESLIGVTILVKGTVLGTTTDIDGNFSLSVSSAPPMTLVISSVGFERQELEINSVNVSGLEIMLGEATLLGQEVVVSASRVEETILESPVSIEKMDILDIQNTAADSYYNAIANLKGVDMTSSSINFQIINSRGFGSTGNTRFVQLIDGMDTQAPALNFPIGNLNGPSMLDVESVELIPGAASALYGPNAFNGVLLINSKNAFDYQGLSAYAKVGANHFGSDAAQDVAPLYEGSIRYAKSFRDKFAFKVNLTYSRADDWHGRSDLDRNETNNPFAGVTDNPGSDRLHFHGDEASINLAIFQLSSDWNTLASTNPTGTGFFLSQYAGDLPNHVVSINPYQEVDLIDYGAENFKINTGLYYRLNDKVEASYLFNSGFGTSIYTGAQRYSLSNFGIAQHRAQLRGDNFYFRAYGTFENSGDSYITEFLTLKMNERFVEQGSLNYLSIPQSQRYVNFISPPAQSVTGYLVNYSLAYLQFLANGDGDLPGLAPGEISTLSDAQRQAYEIAAHNRARQLVDTYFRFDPTSQEFKDIKKEALKGTIPDGPKFADKSAMYQADAQYDFKNEVDFIDLQVGGTFRMFNLNSNGTIFADTADAIQIKEFGAYVQAGKRLNEFVKVSGSLRYDKNENFEGQFNPRLSAVFTVAENHNIRASYQTGFRLPTTQDQYIDLDVLSSRLIGGLPGFLDRYQLPRVSSTGQPLSFTGGSVFRFRDAIFGGSTITDAAALLEPVTNIKTIVPEQVRSIEVGYKSLIANKFFIDLVYYNNQYTDFINDFLIVVADEDGTGAANPATMLTSDATNAFAVTTNRDGTVKTQGGALGIDYNVGRGYTLGFNYSWNQFKAGKDENVVQDFNTPEHKYNIKFGNRKVTDNLGFNVTYRWQEGFRWESSFARGPVPAYATLDAQVSYKLPNIKSVLKVGASNLLNEPYIQSLGAPEIGTIAYISLTFDELMN